MIAQVNDFANVIHKFLDRTFLPLWLQDADRNRRPVFIVGIHRRSGTNYLADSLQLSSQFALPLPIAEDYLLEFSHLLLDYVELTASEQYKKRFAGRPSAFEDCKTKLIHQLGQALIGFLSSYLPAGKRLLTKTPDPWNLKNFFRLFPEALLIIITRDGRDCVESAKWAFPGHSYRYWMSTWAQNARTILQFLENVSSCNYSQVIVTKYETLLSDAEEMQRILHFVGVDAHDYPWDQWRDLPVRGSTFFRGGEDKLHWQPVAKTREFQPVGRWKRWPWWLRWQFRRIAGREFFELTYSWE